MIEYQDDEGFTLYTPHLDEVEEVVQRARKQTKVLEQVKKKRTCKACGAPGHRSDNCPGTSRDANAPAGAAGTRPVGAISEDDFERAKSLQADGESSIGIARELEIPINQVGKIMNSDDYEEYLCKF